MKLRFPLLLAQLLGSVSGALGLSGTVEGQLTPDTRLSGWVVKGSGQPAQELVSTSIGKDGAFSLTLPTAAPATLLPVDDRVAWPGLVDFEKASASAQAAELKFFAYRDTNGNGTRDENEPLSEVRLRTGKSGLLFVVWASNDVTVTGSNGYQADLKAGWNALNVDVRSTVSVRPLDPKTPLQARLGK